ncbi:MAG: hypothetical protein ACK559_10235, partial [bacterium]
MAGNRAEVPPGADQQASPQAAVHHPLPCLAAQFAQRFAQQQSRAAALEQEVVELAATDRVAHDLGIPGVDRGLTDQAGAKRRDRLQRAHRAIRSGAHVLVEVDPPRLHHGRRDPTRADLVAREHGLVEHRHGQARRARCAGAGGTRRATADAQHVAALALRFAADRPA